MDDKSFGEGLFADKLEEAYDQKLRHLGDLIKKLESDQKKYQELFEKQSPEQNREKWSYLRGVTDGIGSAIDFLKYYQNSMSRD